MPSSNEKELWARDLLAARRLITVEEEGSFQRFVELAELGSVGSLFEAKALLSTIMSTPEDNGEGEHVLSILSGYVDEIRIRAILEDLPRLVNEAKDWALSIIETEARFHGDALVAVGKMTRLENRRLLIGILDELASERGSRTDREFAIRAGEGLSRIDE